MNSEPEDVFEGASEPGEEACQGLERQLAVALRPLRLPAGLADRIVTTAQGTAGTTARREAVRPSQRRGAPIPFPISLPARRWLGGAAIAAALIGGVFATEDARQNRARERQRVLATQQFEAASRITDRVLARTREHLEQVGALPDD